MGKITCKAKGCTRTKGVKIYGSFCGIKLAYCPEHNYLFRDIEVINKMAQGKATVLKNNNEKRKEAKKKHREKKWSEVKII